MFVHSTHTARSIVGFFALAALMGSTASNCPAQGTMHACQSSREFYTINLLTGAKTFLFNISAGVQISASLAYDCQTQTTYVSSTFAFAGQSKNIYTLNVATGQATLLGPYGDPAILMHAIEIDPRTGILYGVSIHNHGLYTINRSNGAATLVGLTGIPIGVTTFDSLGYDSDNGVMYLINTGTHSLYTVNLTTGAATLVGPLNGPIGIGGMAYNIDDHTMYLVDNDGDFLFKVSLTTGATSQIGSTGTGNLIGLAYVTPTCPPVPIPGDIDADGDVDMDDLDLFAAVLLAQDTDPDHVSRADLSGDTHADGADIDDFVAAFLNV